MPARLPACVATRLAGVLLLLVSAACSSPGIPEAQGRPERPVPDYVAEMQAPREEYGGWRSETRAHLDDMMSGGEEAPDPANPWYRPILGALRLAGTAMQFFY